VDSRLEDFRKEEFEKGVVCYTCYLNCKTLTDKPPLLLYFENLEIKVISRPAILELLIDS
jgi:hypothetical protein